MGANAREFLLMRMEEESGQLYVPALPKKEIKAKAQTDAQALIDNGDAYIDEVLIDASRITEYLKEFTTQLREKANQSEFRTELKGVKISFRSGKTTYKFEEDSEWVRINNELKAREELLKNRIKSGKQRFDEDASEVPLISYKSGRDTINLTY